MSVEWKEIFIKEYTDSFQRYAVEMIGREYTKKELELLKESIDEGIDQIQKDFALKLRKDSE